jgi:cytochrome c oxidase subunit 1
MNFLVTILNMRTPGMTMHRLPLFVWAMLTTSFIQLIATPALAAALLMVLADRHLGTHFFDPSQGGDVVGYQHGFWFYSHPAVYIMILPGMGVISEVVCGLSRKNVFGYKAIAYSSLGIAFVGFFTWGHHIFVAGQSTFTGGVFGVLSMLVGIFTAIKTFNWIGTMYKGAIAFSTPFAYVCGFIYFLVFGGMTGIALATMSLDAHWHDTYFVVAHFHFIMVGAAIMAFLAALHYWFPKMFGRMYHDGWGLVAAVLIVLGFNATFVPQFLLGNAGMPRRYYTYPAEFQALNVASTAGATLLAFGFIIVAIYLIAALRSGSGALSDNPWESRGYEWQTPSPPPKLNFEREPEFVTTAHHYGEEVGEDVEKGH